MIADAGIASKRVRRGAGACSCGAGVAGNRRVELARARRAAVKDLAIGLHVVARDTPGMVDRIAAAEQAGLDVAWMTSGLGAPDPLAVFAAAAGKTGRIRFGTSIVPTFPRHPLALAQGAMAVDQLAPGRLTLGVGPSHRPSIEGTYGLSFERPLEHLREYVVILDTLFRDAKVSFHGRRLHAEGQLPAPIRVPVMVSALRPSAFRLAGEIAAGAISWVCPPPYLRDTAAPALAAGAEAAGREPPPLVMHVPVLVSENTAAVQAAALKQLSFYPRLPFYSRMFQDAGFPEAARGEFSGAMANAIVISGNEAAVAERIRGLPGFGAREIIVTVVNLEDDAAAAGRTVALLGELARST
jgi:F420-dependent oxidoreductase-like protein